MQPKEFKFYLKFYADTLRVKNHLFKWRVSSRERAFKAIKHFQGMGWKIRAAWFEKTDKQSTRISNEQILGKNI